jgi:hypothetical protein
VDEIEKHGFDGRRRKSSAQQHEQVEYKEKTKAKHENDGPEHSNWEDKTAANGCKLAGSWVGSESSRNQKTTYGKSCIADCCVLYRKPLVAGIWTA